MSEWVLTHQPCPKCGSSDAFSINDKGWGKCYSCNRNIKVDKTMEDLKTIATSTQSKPKDILSTGEYKAISKRGLTEETCKKFGYFVTEHNGQPVQVANYYDDSRKVLAQKLKTPDKKFYTTGDFSKVSFFGQHLWQQGGKRIVITEGEIDAMTVSQQQGHKWPVVSLPSGAQSASAAIKKNLEFLLKFDEVVIMFDNDEVGIEATKAVVGLLPIGKAKYVELPLKDANEMLLAGRGAEIINAIWNAKEFRPDGIVDIDDLLEEIEKPIEKGLSWFIPTLTDLTFGRRPGEVYGFGAGTGVGKTDLFTQQMSYDIIDLNLPVGVIYLEAKPVDTGKRIAGKIDGKRYHIPGGDWDQQQLRETLQKLRGMVTFYDSWGGCEWSIVKDKIRYMVVSKGIKLIYLDHLTALAESGNEKDSLEGIMKEMAGLANELGCIIHYISHLSTPEGKPHEEGGRVMIKHFKGSRAIGFWSFFMFGLERNQQAETDEEKSTTTFRILKDRYTGNATGKTIAMGYDEETGRLFEKGRRTVSKVEAAAVAAGFTPHVFNEAPTIEDEGDGLPF